MFLMVKYVCIIYMGIGDWGLGIGQSPIPNPQSPFFIVNFKIVFK